MTESEFNQQVDDTLLWLEEAIDASGLDIDYENSGGILTITFEENGSQVIVNRQTPVRQLWVAAKNGGHHFDFRDDSWVRDKDGAGLLEVLNQVFTQQAGMPVELE